MYIPDGEKEGRFFNMKPKESHETWAQTNSLLLLGIVDLLEEKGLLDKVRFKYGDAARMPFADNSFDAEWVKESVDFYSERYPKEAAWFRERKYGSYMVTANKPSPT